YSRQILPAVCTNYSAAAECAETEQVRHFFARTCAFGRSRWYVGCCSFIGGVSVKGKGFIVVFAAAVAMGGGAWFGREHVADAGAIVKAKIALMTTTGVGAVDVHARESEQAAVDDGSIKARVEGALNRQPALVESGIQVASVNNGTVLLRGN